MWLMGLKHSMKTEMEQVVLWLVMLMKPFSGQNGTNHKSFVDWIFSRTKFITSDFVSTMILEKVSNRSWFVSWHSITPNVIDYWTRDVWFQNQVLYHLCQTPSMGLGAANRVCKISQKLCIKVCSTWNKVVIYEPCVVPCRTGSI